MIPRDRLELRVLELTGDAELAEKVGRLAWVTVVEHAALMAELTPFPAEFWEPQLWERLTQ